MKHLNWQRNPELLAIFNVVAVVSLLGNIYCLIALATDFSDYPTATLLVYSIWFVACITALFLMKRGDVWGAYSLAFATILVGIYELVTGIASFGGAILALCIILLLLFYLRYMWQLENDENKRIHNPS
jgi:hypothetical protein